MSRTWNLDIPQLRSFSKFIFYFDTWRENTNRGSFSQLFKLTLINRLVESQNEKVLHTK